MRPQVFIACEGECRTSARRPTFTIHDFRGERAITSGSNGDLREFGFEQIYSCSQCHTERRFGFTQTRVTLVHYRKEESK